MQRTSRLLALVLLPAVAFVFLWFFGGLRREHAAFSGQGGRPVGSSFVSNDVVGAETAEAVPVQTPVQPVEERGDAMLFEGDALQGTPFDRQVTQPFD